MPNFVYFTTRWLIPSLAAVAVAGGVLYWQWPTGAGLVSAPDASDNASTSTKTPLSSADVVDVHVSRHASKVDVSIAVDKQWHINANPASLDFLIPTRIEITAQGVVLPMQLHYPSGHTIDAGLGKPIRVYSERTVLTAALSGQTADMPLQVNARVQACNDSGRCLAPATLSTTIKTTRPVSR